MTGLRVALAALCLSLFGTVYLLNALLGPGPFVPVFVGLALVYETAFVALAARWFWGRWYASGVGLFGVVVGLLLLFSLGPDPIAWIFLGLHGVAVLGLVGHGPAELFDARLDWRERLHIDDVRADQLGKSIRAAGMSLPFLVMNGLAPRPGAGALALVLGALALHGFVRGRAFAILAAAGAAGASAFAACGASRPAVGVAATVLLAAACAPWAKTTMRYLRG